MKPPMKTAVTCHIHPFESHAPCVASGPAPQEAQGTTDTEKTRYNAPNAGRNRIMRVRDAPGLPHLLSTSAGSGQLRNTARVARANPPHRGRVCWRSWTHNMWRTQLKNSLIATPALRMASSNQNAEFVRVGVIQYFSKKPCLNVGSVAPPSGPWRHDQSRTEGVK